MRFCIVAIFLDLLYLNLMVQGCTICSHFFQMAISHGDKWSGGPKFHNLSWFTINLLEIKKKKIGFHIVFGWSGRWRHNQCAPHTQVAFKSLALLGLIRLNRLSCITLQVGGYILPPTIEMLGKWSTLK